MVKEKLKGKTVLEVILLTLTLLLMLTGNFTPQIREAKASLSGSWYMVQMDTHSDYSLYLPVDNATSLWQMAKFWAEAGYDAMLIKDYHVKVVETGYVGCQSQASFDDSSGRYNYSVTSSPSESIANFSASYPNYGGGTGAGRLYVNGTGRAMVSHYNDTWKGRRSLDLHRWHVVSQFALYANYSGNVASGIEIRFTSGRKLVLYQENGTSSGYTNSSTVRYFETLQGIRSISPHTVVDVLSVQGQYLCCKHDYNDYLNITKAYLETWGQTAYLNDKIFDFQWFTESFDSYSWISVFTDNFLWAQYTNWDNYLADIALAENDHDIIIIAGLEVTQGPGKNQAYFFNVNSSAENVYNGSISQYLNLPTEASDRGGLAFTEELYKYPNGTDYPDGWASVNITDWLNRGFKGRALRYSQWDNALTTCYNNKWYGGNSLPFFKGSDVHNCSSVDSLMKVSYTMVYVEGDLTKANIVSAIEAGHFYAVEHYNHDTVRTNLTIAKFDINDQWTMSDWATPKNRVTLNIQVDCDVQISNVTLIWNENQLRTWAPNTNSFSTSLDVSFGGYFRLFAKDQDQDYIVSSNAIFVTPTTPYVTETTHPLFLSSKYESEKLTLSISGATGQTSTTRVHCGVKGKPTAVYASNGTLTWSYNASTTILTLNVTHASPTRILIYWKIPGDVNDNGIVDLHDLAKIGKAYEVTPVDPKWDEDCDINGDAIIDIFDIGITSAHWGESW